MVRVGTVYFIPLWLFLMTIDDGMQNQACVKKVYFTPDVKYIYVEGVLEVDE